jgi:NADPH:quinone reductase-like Zn-dependent oxidoreductase
VEAVVLTGHGGFEKLEYRVDVPTPRPSRGEVLIRVSAAGVNNTDINTRTGWYSKSVREGSSSGGSGGFAALDSADAAWGGTPIRFPRIQGADVCGHIEQVGEDVDPARIGERVLVRTMLRAPVGHRPYECVALGSECDGGFAQLVVAPADDTHAVRCDWTDAELASIPCAYSTAENMLHRTGTGAETVLVTGASGGVGSAAVQLARARARRSSPWRRARRPTTCALSAPTPLSTAPPIYPRSSATTASTSWWTWSVALTGRRSSTS